MKRNETGALNWKATQSLSLLTVMPANVAQGIVPLSVLSHTLRSTVTSWKIVPFNFDEKCDRALIHENARKECASFTQQLHHLGNCNKVSLK